MQFQSELPRLQGKYSSAKLSWKESPDLFTQYPIILCMATEERGGKASKKLWLFNILSVLSHVGLLFCFFPSASLVIMDVTVQEHNLTCLFDFLNFLKIPSYKKLCNLQPCLVALPSLSLEGCFIFLLEFSMPCFPLHTKRQKSRWWTHCLSTRVSCPVCLTLSPPTNTSLPVWSSPGELKQCVCFPHDLLSQWITWAGPGTKRQKVNITQKCV